MARITDNERDARRKGKKIAQHHSDACEGVINTFDIRLTDKDRFTAEYLGEWYEAETIPALKVLLDDEVRKLGPTSWSYFIEVDDVDFEKPADQHHYYGSRDKIRIEVDYRVIKLSNVINPTGKSFKGAYENRAEPYRLLKHVDVYKDGTLTDSQDQRKAPASERLGKTLVPYTPERWAALEGIAAAARELGRRMAQMLNGEKAVAFLDDQARLQVLALPPAPPPPVADKPKKAVRR